MLALWKMPKSLTLAIWRHTLSFHVYVNLQTSVHFTAGYFIKWLDAVLYFILETRAKGLDSSPWVSSGGQSKAFWGLGLVGSRLRLPHVHTQWILFWCRAYGTFSSCLWFSEAWAGFSPAGSSHKTILSCSLSFNCQPAIIEGPQKICLKIKSTRGANFGVHTNRLCTSVLLWQVFILQGYLSLFLLHADNHGCSQWT